MTYEDVQKLVISKSNNDDYVCVTYTSVATKYYGRLVRVYCSGDGQNCQLVVEHDEKYDIHFDISQITNIELVDFDLGI